MTNFWRLVSLSVALAAVCTGPGQAADSPPPPPPPPANPTPPADPLASARGHIAASRWAAALAELRRLDTRASADWNNLMGYALRKQAPPDLAGAQAHYDAALAIDPRHRGALEYAGELGLMKGDLAQAERHAATLAQVCPAGCEERADLLLAIERFKTQGRRTPP